MNSSELALYLEAGFIDLNIETDERFLPKILTNIIFLVIGFGHFIFNYCGYRLAYNRTNTIILDMLFRHIRHRLA